MFKRSLKSMLLACARLGSLGAGMAKKTHPPPSKSSSSWSDFRKTQMKQKLLDDLPNLEYVEQKKLEDMITFHSYCIFGDLNCSFVLRNFPSMFFFSKVTYIHKKITTWKNIGFCNIRFFFSNCGWVLGDQVAWEIFVFLLRGG